MLAVRHAARTGGVESELQLAGAVTTAPQPQPAPEPAPETPAAFGAASRRDDPDPAVGDAESLGFGRRDFTRPPLGDGRVFGGSALAIAGYLAVGTVFLFLGVAVAQLNAVLIPLPAGALFLFAGLCAWRTRLVVGEFGFVYSSLFGTRRVYWEEVAKCRERHSLWLGLAWLGVDLFDGHQLMLGILGFSESREDISDVMFDCQQAFLRDRRRKAERSD
jgi:hypothetical protein